MKTPDIFILTYPKKPLAGKEEDRLVEALGKKCTIIGRHRLEASQAIPEIRADYVISLGGDGTILRVARALGPHPIPIIGVNLGKLGYLAEYAVEELIREFEHVVETPELISERMMLETDVSASRKAACFRSLALNDVCIIAGSPFRMIEMEVRINQQLLTRVRGDGLIFSTPTGSTAYNMSVGGPILLPKVKAIVVSPIAPHSLSFRPLVVDSDSRIEIKMVAVNEGTTLVVDGQLSHTLAAGDVLHIQRFENDCRIVRHIRNTPWETLTTKLGWAQGPRYSDAT